MPIFQGQQASKWTSNFMGRDSCWPPSGPWTLDVSRLAPVEVTHLFTILPKAVSATRRARCRSLSRDATSQRQTFLFSEYERGNLSTNCCHHSSHLFLRLITSVSKAVPYFLQAETAGKTSREAQAASLDN